jgi:phosphatidylglycerophosphatase A
VAQPFPIKLADEKGGKGVGVVLDDVIAGIFTLILMHIIQFL